MGKGIRLISCMVVLFAAAVSAAGMPNGELQVTGKMAAPRCEMIVPLSRYGFKLNEVTLPVK
ncbi:TPA: hypothetical protein I8552_003943 [Serratia marcescens]|nr:hypothetical protein [Serratia marcescens]